MTVRVINADVIDGLSQIEPGSVNTCVTSPPYWGLRDYGVDGQIGLEATPEDYVGRMVEVFRAVWPTLRDDATLWLNLGDSYASTGGHTSHGASSQMADRRAFREGVALTPCIVPPGLKQKDLVGVPWRVAFALQADGWYLRSDIIWSKPNPMPESVTDRPTKAHEYVFLLSKRPKYYYDADAIREQTDHVGASWEDRQAMGFKGDTKHPTRDAIEAGMSIPSFAANTEGRNRRTVWTVPTAPYKGAHFAVFPPDLIRPCILAGCPQGGTVLDPFAGSGTTGAVAEMEGRSSILIEINSEYCELIKRRTAQRGLFT